MRCCDCDYHISGYMYNKCCLTGDEYYHECYERPCDIINDNYIFITDCPEMGFVKGKSSKEYMNL